MNSSALSLACLSVAIAATVAHSRLPAAKPTSSDIDKLFASPNSLGSVAIGMAEGTRTADGGKTQYWANHIDPGNLARNQGTFSYQHSASSPEEADNKQLVKLRRFSNELASKAKAEGLELNSFEVVAGSDLFNQSEMAGHDYLDNLKRCREWGKTGTDAVLCARVQSYYRPDGTLDAPGLGNTRRGVEADQKRRLDAIAEVIQ